MKIVLLKNIPKLGIEGEIKEVKEGYAKNFLIPQGLADFVTKHSMSVIKAQKTKKEKTIIQDKKNKIKYAKKLNRKKIVISVAADEKGTLYAGLDKKSISNELKKLGYEIDIKEIKLKETIKKIGKKKVELKIAKEKAIMTLDIQSK